MEYLRLKLFRTIGRQQTHKKSDKKKTNDHKNTGHADRPEKEMKGYDSLVLECDYPEFKKIMFMNNSG